MSVNKNIVMTQNQMDNLNTRLGSFDGENAGQKYYSINNGFFNYGEWYWDVMNEIEPLLASGSMIGAYDYGHERNQAIALGQPGGDDDTYAEPNAKTWLCHQNEANFLDCTRSRNGYATGRQEPIYQNILAVIAATWEGRSENATINGTTRTKNEWSELFANFVFDELVERSQDDKLDFKNGTATYTTNATFGTTVKYPQSGSNGGYVESEPNYEMIGQLKRYVLMLSLIRSQIDDDPVINEASQAGGGTKIQQVDEWLQGAGDYVYYWFEQEMDIWWTSSWRTQSNLNNGIDALSPASSSQSAVYYTSSNTPVNTINQLQTLTMSNRHWATYGFLHAVGTYYNNSTWKDDTETIFQLYFKMQIFPDNSFSEWYRSYAGLPAGGMNYFIVTMWEVVDFAFTHAVAVTNGVAGVTDVGKYFNYTTSEGSDEVVQNWSTTSTSGGTKGIENTLIEISKYFRTPANGGYLGNRYVIGGSILQDPTDYRYGQIAALANTWYDNSDLADFAEMSTSVGYDGQGYFGDGQGTANIPNWELPLSGPFGAWRAAIDYQEQNDVFTAQAPSTLKAFPTAEGFGKFATGGRGTTVYKVTNTNASGAGSFADAVSADNRIIVFDVAGQINVSGITWSGNNLTIEGATSPSQGIEIVTTGEVVLTGDNNIIRNLRLRGSGSNGDVFRIEGDGITTENIILDRCTFSYGSDETLTTYGDNGGVVQNVTIQRTVINENQGSGGTFMFGNSDNISWWENFSVLHPDREHFYNSTGDGEYEAINNLVYGFDQNNNVHYGTKVDFIGNVAKFSDDEAPTGITQYTRLTQSANTAYGVETGHYYQTDNILLNNYNSWVLTDTTWDANAAGSRWFTSSLITPYTSANTETNVLANAGAYSGTSLGTDNVHARLVDHYNNDTGQVNQGIPSTDGYTNPSASSRSVGYDSVITGIPDSFSNAHGITSANGTKSSWDFGGVIYDNSGTNYTNIEMYFFALNRDFGNTSILPLTENTFNKAIIYLLN